MRESTITVVATGEVVRRTVVKPVSECLKARADHDAVVPWLKAHNEAFADVVDFGAPLGMRWLVECSCGWEDYDRLYSDVMGRFRRHASLEQLEPVAIGKFTVEV